MAPPSFEKRRRLRRPWSSGATSSSGARLTRPGARRRRSRGVMASDQQESPREPRPSWQQRCEERWGLARRGVPLPPDADWEALWVLKPFERNLLRNPNPEGKRGPDGERPPPCPREAPVAASRNPRRGTSRGHTALHCRSPGDRGAQKDLSRLSSSSIPPSAGVNVSEPAPPGAPQVSLDSQGEWRASGRGSSSRN